MFELSVPLIRVVAGVLLIGGAMFAGLLVLRLRTFSLPAMLRRQRPLRATKGWRGAWYVGRDVAGMVIGLSVGILTWMLADSLAPFRQFSGATAAMALPSAGIPTALATAAAPRRIVGTLTAVDVGEAEPFLRVTYQPLDTNAVPIQKPVVVQGYGDAIVVGYTFVRINDAFLLRGNGHGVKLDYVGTDWLGRPPTSFALPRLGLIDGGRPAALAVPTPATEWAFPYNIWVEHARPRTITYAVHGQHTHRWSLIAVADALFLEPETKP